MSWVDTNNAKMVDVLSPMARAYNGLLASILATVGLAIPLTANIHTPKLIQTFLRDRTNQVMLSLFAFGAANVLWVDYIIGPKFAPVWAFRISVYGVLLGWAALIPYYFYVVRFLDPSNILSRLQADITREIDKAAAGKADVEVSQDIIHERLGQIGTILLKAIDRHDRSVVTEGVWILKLLCDHYGTRKKDMADPWFKVDRKDFVGLSAEAIDLINQDRTWLEYMILRQLLLCYKGALSRSPDAVSSISDAARIIATRAAQRRDEADLRLSIRHFNNFLREGIRHKETNTIQDVLYQYRQLAIDIGRESPEALLQIVRSFHRYSDEAASAGLKLVPDVASFDLSWMVRHAYDTTSPVASQLLDQMIGLDHVTHGKTWDMAIKAKIILGAAFLESGRKAEASRVRACLKDVSADHLASLGRELTEVTDPAHFEVTTRQVNMEYCKPERRAKVLEFIEAT